jgi:hypothetical protein
MARVPDRDVLQDSREDLRGLAGRSPLSPLVGSEHPPATLNDLSPLDDNNFSHSMSVARKAMGSNDEDNGTVYADIVGNTTERGTFPFYIGKKAAS